MGFSRQDYWSGLPLPSPWDLPAQGSKPGLLHCRQILSYLSGQRGPVVYSHDYNRSLFRSSCPSGTLCFKRLGVQCCSPCSLRFQERRNYARCSVTIRGPDRKASSNKSENAPVTGELVAQGQRSLKREKNVQHCPKIRELLRRPEGIRSWQ